MKTLEHPSKTLQAKAPAHLEEEHPKQMKFADNRPAAQLQRNMQDIADSGPLNQKNIQLKSLAQKSVSVSSSVAQLVKQGRKYPAYQTFKGNNGITYCSSTKFNGHGPAAAWIASVIAQNPGVGARPKKPRLVQNQPRNATIV